MVEMERITFKVWRRNKQAISDYQKIKGLNKSQAINHMLRIAQIAMKNEQWIKEMRIDMLPIEGSGAASELDHMFFNPKK